VLHHSWDSHFIQKAHHFIQSLPTRPQLDQVRASVAKGVPRLNELRASVSEFSLCLRQSIEKIGVMCDGMSESLIIF